MVLDLDAKNVGGNQMSAIACEGFNFAGLRDSVSVSTVSMNKYTPELKEVPRIDPGVNLAYKTLTAGAAAVTFLHYGFLRAHAQDPKDVIPTVFGPIKDLILSVAEPLCYIMFAWGCIECICKRPASGLDRMKYAAIGFIGVQLIPVMMAAIKSVSPA